MTNPDLYLKTLLTHYAEVFSREARAERDAQAEWNKLIRRSTRRAAKPAQNNQSSGK